MTSRPPNTQLGPALPNNDQSTGSEETSPWTKYYADEDLERTETRVLQQEGDELLKILEQAFPEDNRSAWSYQDLQAAVLQSQQEWTSKSRLGGGKPQKLFHGLMSKFNSYSNLCRVIPEGDKYISIVTGAVTILVQASAKHSKTAVELSEAMDVISEEVELCDVQTKLVRSRPMQKAIQRLYMAIFLFFGDAAKWYKSSSKKKVLNSLHNDFAGTFVSSLEKIKQLSAHVQRVAALGQGSEVRVMHTEVNELQEELRDMRVGQSGQLRAIAEFLMFQHNQNVDQHRKTRELFEEYLSNPSKSTFSIANGEPPGVHSLISQTGSNDSIIARSLPASANKNSGSRALQIKDRSSDEEQDHGMLCHSVEQAIRNIASQLQCPLAEISSPRSIALNMHDTQISMPVNKWLAEGPSLLYLEYRGQIGSEDSIRAVADQAVEICQSGNRPTISSTYAFASLSEAEDESAATLGIARLTIDICYKAIQMIAENEKCDTSELRQYLAEKSIGSSKSSLYDLSTLFPAVLGALPSNSHIVIRATSTSSNISERVESSSVQTAGAARFVKSLRQALERGNVTKVVFMTTWRVHWVVSQLQDSEITLAHRQMNAKIIPKGAIVSPF